MSGLFKKQSVLWLLALVLALVMAPSAAFAEGEGDDATATPEPGTLSVYMQVQTGVDEEGVATYSTEQLVKAFTADEIAALQAANTEPVAGMFAGKGGAVTVCAAKAYVTVGQLLEAAGVEMLEGDQLAFTCTDGPYAKFAAQYADLFADNKFFPAYAGGTDYDASGAEASSAVFAFSSGKASLTVNAAAAKAEALEAAAQSDFAQFCIGQTEAAYKEGLRPGNNFPSGIVSVTIKKPVKNAQFSIFAQGQTGVDADGNATYGDEQLVKAFTADEIAALQAANTEPVAGMFAGKGGAVTVCAAKAYVTVGQLLEAAGVEMLEGDQLAFTCTDGPYAKFAAQYADLFADNKFFPAYAGGTDYDASGAEASSAVFAFSSGKASLTVNAAAAKAEALEAAAQSDFAQFCIGQTEAAYKEGLRPGNNFPSGIVSVTIKMVPAKDLSAATVTFPKASIAYTGKAITQIPTVTLDGVQLTSGLSFKASFANNTNVGEAKATITGIGRYFGTTTGTFKIEAAAQTLKVKNKTVAKLSAKKLAKKGASVGAAKVKKGNSAKTSISYKLVKANKSKAKFKVASNGKITVKKGLKKGTYKLTIKATAKATKNYKKAEKNFTVTIKVTK